MKLNIIIIITILCAFMSCKKDKDIIDNKSSYTIDPIDSKIIINIGEYLNDAGNNFGLLCFTEEIYGARCYRIVTNSSLTDSIINIAFEGIQYPTNLACSDAPSPAYSSVELGVLPKETYTLNISLNKQKFKGTIVVSDTNYILHLDSNEYIGIERSKLNKLPPNTIWGYIHSYDVQYDYLIPNFIDSLKKTGAVEKDYPVGEYFYFLINNKGQILNGDINPEEYFLYEFKNAKEQLPELVTWLRNEFNPSGISGSHKGYVMIYDSFGNSY